VVVEVEKKLHEASQEIQALQEGKAKLEAQVSAQQEEIVQEGEEKLRLAQVEMERLREDLQRR
jgi:multidrug resistance efflux pump